MTPQYSSLQLRRAQPGDARGVAAVHVGSWQAAYQGLLAKSFLDALDIDERAKRYRLNARGPNESVVWIATRGEDVVGFVAVGRCRDVDQPDSGEVWALYVAPSNWRSGIGSRLIAKGEQLLVKRGFADATLWVLEGNTQGRRFYERAGWHCDGAVQMVQVGGRDMSEVRYRKSLSRPNNKATTPP